MTSLQLLYSIQKYFIKIVYLVGLLMLTRHMGTLKESFELASYIRIEIRMLGFIKLAGDRAPFITYELGQKVIQNIESGLQGNM